MQLIYTMVRYGISTNTIPDVRVYSTEERAIAKLDSINVRYIGAKREKYRLETNETVWQVLPTQLRTTEV